MEGIRGARSTRVPNNLGQAIGLDAIPARYTCAVRGWRCASSSRPEGFSIPFGSIGQESQLDR
jgi:hypothetical protein